MNHTQYVSSFARRYGPWAIVTGASSGIGRAMAVRLAMHGIHLVIVARRSEELERLADEVRAQHAIDVRIVVADLATADGLADVEHASAGLDVGLVVAAAGFGTSGSFLDGNPVVERNMIDVNCAALYSACYAFGRRLAQRGSGGIVLMASLVGYQGVPFAAHYAATKAYVQTLAEGLHVELKALGVDVLASAPGPVRSGFESRANMRMNSAVDPDDVARETFTALGRRTTVVPGLLSKVLTGTLAPLPRLLRTIIMSRVMGDMTKHQRV